MEILFLPTIGSEVLSLSAWLVNIMAGLYLSLLFLVHKNRMKLTIWLLGFCLLTFLFTRTLE